jgi:hypothetical protein
MRELASAARAKAAAISALTSSRVSAWVSVGSGCGAGGHSWALGDYPVPRRGGLRTGGGLDVDQPMVAAFPARRRSAVKARHFLRSRRCDETGRLVPGQPECDKHRRAGAQDDQAQAEGGPPPAHCFLGDGPSVQAPCRPSTCRTLVWQARILGARWLAAEHSLWAVGAGSASGRESRRPGWPMWTVPASVDTRLSCPIRRESEKWVRHAAHIRRSARRIR